VTDWFLVSVNVRQGGISNILEEQVVQPLLVSISALTLATETVRCILKIDDIVRNCGSNGLKDNTLFMFLLHLKSLCFCFCFSGELPIEI